MPSLFARITLYIDFLKSLLRANKGLITGMWKLTKLPQPAITVFGGTHLEKDSTHALMIQDLAERLAHAGFSIITGGGPGIMEAANIGARKHLKLHEKYKEIDPERLLTMGISLTNLQSINASVQEYILQPYFFTRKWLLIRYAVGFIVGPGGFGTLDELAEVLTLLQTHRMPNTPVVLIGTDYWKPFLEWVSTRALKNGLLSAKDAALLQVTDSVDEAFNIIHTQCFGCTGAGAISAPSTETHYKKKS